MWNKALLLWQSNRFTLIDQILILSCKIFSFSCEIEAEEETKVKEGKDQEDNGYVKKGTFMSNYRTAIYWLALLPATVVVILIAEVLPSAVMLFEYAVSHYGCNQFY